MLLNRIVEIKLAADGVALPTGDSAFIWCVPSELNGYSLIEAAAFVTTVSSSGTPTYQVRNVTQAADMLSTRVSIDANENTSYTAATRFQADKSNDDVAAGDLIAIDKDVAGTGEAGDGVILTFEIL